MAQSFDLQGHRGCRALMPENTIPAFFKAVELGVTTLEMDVVISKDGQIVVSHEPWMSDVICSHPDGRPVKKSEAKKLNLYRMDYAEIQKYDCGLRLHPKFPDQKKVPAVKPSLKAVVKSVERFAEENRYTRPRFNIELKSEPGAYDKFQPIPARFVEMVVTEIRRLGTEEMTSLQSFDINVLEELNKIPDRKFEISYLVERGKNLDRHLQRLSFKPEIFSPRYSLVTEATINECHEKRIRIIPWTVNDRGDFERLKGWSVDGVITDVITW